MPIKRRCGQSLSTHIYEWSREFPVVGGTSGFSTRRYRGGTGDSCVEAMADLSSLSGEGNGERIVVQLMRRRSSIVNRLTTLTSPRPATTWSCVHLELCAAVSTYTTPPGAVSTWSRRDPLDSDTLLGTRRGTPSTCCCRRSD